MKKVIQKATEAEQAALNMVLYDIEMPEEAEDRAVPEAFLKPGAHFRSVFGQSIYNGARSILRSLSREYAWGKADRAAAWPSILIGQVKNAAAHDLAKKLPGHPDAEELKYQDNKACHSMKAYEVASRRYLEHPGRDPNLTHRARVSVFEAHGAAHMSRHVELSLRSRLMKDMIAEAEILHSKKSCPYAEAMVKWGKSFADGERDRKERMPKAARDRPPVGPEP